ncbi:unnamed protein product [Lymnaea stagnalis]|uniref:RRM domain-containing protein n=1 Tax=Lymnaea stagnalis TaxID=6523 RepID=A0AAV2HSR9_LYMST
MADSQIQEPNETQLETQEEQAQNTEPSDSLENPAAPSESQAINEAAGTENGAVNDPSEDVGETKPKEKIDKKKGDDLDEDGDEDDDDDEDNINIDKNADPNVMPQVNVSLLAKRKWQVKVYPLKAGNFTSGQITSVFQAAKESLIYIVAMNKYASGKGEMFASSTKQAIRVVHNLMKLEFLYYPEINIEIIKKNGEGAVEQKALLRFDPKLVRMLCIPPLPRRHGKKFRNRVIGSVFVKNLPNDTSKEMLRVLFPFATEINYTPDKFKDGTARLVLENRSSVFHCLKAFTKVELGGNILEFHPLEKRRESESKTTNIPKEQVVGDKVENEEEKSKEADSKDSVDPNTPVESKEKTLSSETKAAESKSPQKGPLSQKEIPKKTPTTSKNVGPPREYKREFRSRGRGTWISRRRDQGPINSYQEKKKVGGPPGKPVLRKPEVASRARANRPDIRKGPLGWDSAGNRSPIRQNQNRGNRGGSGNRNNRNNSVWNSRASGGRNSFSSGGGYATGGRADRRFEQQSFGGGMAGASGDMGINVEATKEMMLLQSQLSMAIKNQIAMLNQTQIAVEQAKRGAGMGLTTTDLTQASSSGEGSRAFGAGAKRRASQSGFSSDYGDDSFGGKRQNLGLGSQQRSWAEESPADYYGMQQSQPSLDYGVDRQTEDTTSAYSNSYTSRNLSQSNAGYDQSPYRYHY